MVDNRKCNKKKRKMLELPFCCCLSVFIVIYGYLFVIHYSIMQKIANLSYQEYFLLLYSARSSGKKSGKFSSEVVEEVLS